jgi:hypothetical protein
MSVIRERLYAHLVYHNKLSEDTVNNITAQRNLGTSHITIKQVEKIIPRRGRERERERDCR